MSNYRSFADIPKDELREISRKGGINSGKSKRRMKLLARIMDAWIMDALTDFDKSLHELETSFDDLAALDLEELERITKEKAEEE